jgi:hypothetical protein
MRDSQETEKILGDLIQLQRKKVSRLAEELGARLTAEDILNPHDYPELIKSPRFNFEDGILAGLLSAQMALRQAQK